MDNDDIKILVEMSIKDYEYIRKLVDREDKRREQLREKYRKSKDTSYNRGTYNTIDKSVKLKVISPVS